MLFKGRAKFDRTTRKEIYKFKNKNFKHYNKKVCSVKNCGRHLRYGHHYLCQVHWLEKERRRNQQFDRIEG